MRPGARLFSALILAPLLVAGDGRAQEAQPSAYQLKAAFLYNFAQFVDWSPTAFASNTAPFVIGILGENPFGRELEQTVRGKAVLNHALMVKEVRSVAEATNTCHILFISASEKKRLAEIFAGLRGASILTVGEVDRFTESGGMVNFLQAGTKIRFQINDAAAKSAGLKVSSKLLSLASRTAR